MDLGNEVYAAWLQHVAGDALAEAHAKNCEMLGDLMECIMALCQMSTEWHDPSCGPQGLSYLTIPAAYQTWQYIETGVRAYNGYYVLDPSWAASFRPTALTTSNRGRLKTSQSPMGPFRSGRGSPGGHGKAGIASLRIED